MDNLLEMSTTGRHNLLTSSLFSRIFNLVVENKVLARQEQYSIVYYGKKSMPNDVSLVEIEDIEDAEYFLNDTIYELNYVQPDFVLFKDNSYLTDKKDLKTAGQPDLIVEVWSDGNTPADRAFLQKLYASSNITEFWQIEQNSNIVKCSIGMAELPEQSLTNILITQKGLEFDLRYLAM